MLAPVGLSRRKSPSGDPGCERGVTSNGAHRTAARVRRDERTRLEQANQLTVPRHYRAALLLLALGVSACGEKPVARRRDSEPRSGRRRQLCREVRLTRST